MTATDDALEVGMMTAINRGAGSIVHVLLCGRAGAAEFSGVEAELSRQLTGAEIRRTEDVSPAVRAELLSHPGWDLIVVCQSWPDEYTAQDVEFFLTLAAASRVLCCYGSWCISDGRTRTLWPPAVRVPVDQFALRLRMEVDVLHGRSAPLPVTASADELFAASAPESDPLGAGLAVRVSSPDPVYRAAVKEALRETGCRIAADGPDDRFDTIIVDVDPWNADRSSDVHSLRRLHSGVRIVATAGFPSVTLKHAVTAAGADALVGKSSGLDGLIAALRPAIENAQH